VLGSTLVSRDGECGEGARKTGFRGRKQVSCLSLPRQIEKKSRRSISPGFLTHQRRSFVPTTGVRDLLAAEVDKVDRVPSASHSSSNVRLRRLDLQGLDRETTMVRLPRLSPRRAPRGGAA